MTKKELFDLSERFQEKCGDILDHEGCGFCPFKGSNPKYECPEFFFKSIEQVEKVFDFIGYEDQEMIVGEAILETPQTTFITNNFKGCDFYSSGSAE